MGKKLNIILADDVSMHRVALKATLRGVLKDLGYEMNLVGEAENGADLVRLFSESPSGSLDLVFSDIRMPVLDGLSALVKIKALNSRQKIVMVSSEDIKTIEKAQAGAQEALAKSQTEALSMLSNVSNRLKKNEVAEGKINSILVGCEKLSLDPIFIAQHYGAIGYLRKPYDPAKTKEILEFVLKPTASGFLAKV
jgi:CheY-like chemotaxis protein